MRFRAERPRAPADGMTLTCWPTRRAGSQRPVAGPRGFFQEPRAIALRRAAVLGAAAFVAACASNPPAPEPVQPAVAKEEPPLPRPVTQRRLAASWSFRDGGEGCFAVASARGAVFRVATNRAGTALSVHVPPGAGTVRGRGGSLQFQGAAGSWTVPARIRGRTLQSYAPLTEEAAGRVLVLLAGGVLRPLRSTEGWPVLSVPAAGDPGRAWFECVRRGLKG